MKKKATRTFLFICILSALGGFTFPAGQSSRIFFFGGLDHHFILGSAQDYALGENDFPVTPVHSPALGGLSFSHTFNPFALEIDWRYTTASQMTLEDPSDNDTVEIHSAPHLTISLSFLYHFFPGRISPYILAGGGADIAFPRAATYTTQYGYEIIMAVPPIKDRWDWEAHAGCGFVLFLKQWLALRVDIRHSWIFDSPHTVKSLQAIGGVEFSF